MVKILKLFLLFLAISIVKAVPLTSRETGDKNELRKLRMKQFTRERLLSKRYQSVRNELDYQELLKNSEEPIEVEFNEINVRLPNNTIPLHYDIRVNTSNLHTGALDDQGNVRINIRTLERTNTITLHSTNLNFDFIFLFESNGRLLDFNPQFTNDNQTELLVITTPRHLEVGEEIVVDIGYTGNLRRDFRGLFQSFFVDPETNQQSWFASTNFLPVNARFAFPCYDEVRYRTTFQLSIIHHNSYHAISNMPVDVAVGSGEFVLTVFQQTPSMQTYLLTFTISRFGHVSNNNLNLPMSIYAQPAAISAGQANNSLLFAERTLRALEDLFQIPYSLPKSDMVGVNFGSVRRGAEYWGLISIVNNDLLQTNASDISAQNRREIQIAHEYSVSLC